MTRQQFIKTLAEYPGVTWDETMLDAGLIQIDAPAGLQFNDGCHTIVEAFNNTGGQSWKPQAYADVAARLTRGLCLCDVDCDVCQEAL